MKRREFVKSSILSGLFYSFWISGCQKKSAVEKDYAAIYLRKAIDILRGIEKYETPKLIQGAIRAAELHKANGQLFSHTIWGHSPIYETRAERLGNPNLLPQWNWDITPETFNRLSRGDFYFTNDVTEPVLASKERGTYVVGVSVPYLPNKYIPSEKLVASPDLLSIEEVSNIVLYSHVPYQDGLVDFSNYPMVPLCPGSAISQFCYYWMMTAEISYHLRVKKTYPFVSKAREFLIHIINLIHEIDEQMPVIKRAATKMAENVIRGGTLYVYDKSHTLTSEACGRASGLMMTKALNIENLKKYDNVIFGAEISNDSDDLKKIQKIRDKQAFVVTISAFDTDGDNTGERLYKYANVALNNLSGESDGIVRVMMDEPRICPASGVMNIILLWSLTAQFIGEMIRCGIEPYIYMGYHIKGGRAYNNATMPFFFERGF